MKKRVLLAMSGGVDSTVAAHLLKNQGYSVHGVCMLLGRDASSCDKNRNLVAKALAAAERADIGLTVIDLRRSFHDRVIKGFLESWEQGLTPNPCVFCNRNFKFRLMEAVPGHYDYFATGHYAKTAQDQQSGEYYATEAKDKSKDQSYMFAYLSSDILSRLLMPLGDYLKSEVREIASDLGLPQAKSAESQDICFVDAGLPRFFGDNPIKVRQGDFVDKNGKVLGPHKGICHYTCGQTRRLGIALGKKRYVTGIDPLKGQIVLGDADELFKKRFYLADLFFPGPQARKIFFDPESENALTMDSPSPCSVVTRYHAKKSACKLRPRYILKNNLPPYMRMGYENEPFYEEGLSEKTFYSQSKYYAQTLGKAPKNPEAASMPTEPFGAETTGGSNERARLMAAAKAGKAKRSLAELEEELLASGATHRFGLFGAKLLSESDAQAIMLELKRGNEVDPKIIFEASSDTAIRAPAPGQAAVFFKENRVLGGGCILHRPQELRTEVKIGTVEQQIMSSVG